MRLPGRGIVVIAGQGGAAAVAEIDGLMGLDCWVGSDTKDGVWRQRNKGVIDTIVLIMCGFWCKFARTNGGQRRWGHWARPGYGPPIG